MTEGRQHSQVLIEEHVDDEITSFRMVEEDKETPVNQPGTLLQSYQGIGELLKQCKIHVDTNGLGTVLQSYECIEKLPKHERKHLLI